VLSGGHLLAEEGLTAHVPLYGDFFRCLRRLDAPGIDCLTSLPPDVPWFIARLAASAAELNGDRVVMSETSDHSQVWRPPGDTRPRRTVTEAEIRGTCNRLVVSGVNSITSYYSFADLPDDALRRLNEWVGRCCTMLAGGHQVADVAMVYPVESLWTKFVPANLWANASPDANRIEGIYRTAMEGLYASRHDFTIVDSRTLAEASAGSGALTHGQLRWRVVVLPAVDTLPLEAWENLARFVAKGGVLIELGALPVNSANRFPDAKVGRLARSIFGEPGHEPTTQVNRAGGAGIHLPSGSEALLPLVLEGFLEPAVKIADRSAPIRSTHRRLEGHDVFFLINDSPKPWSGQADLAAQGVGERWDPASGGRAAVSGGTAVPLELEPYGAVLFRFRAARLPDRLHLRTGALPNLALSTLPRVEPILAQGEFVRGGVGLDPELARSDRPVWKAAATLTKSQVDTFQFVRLPFAEPVDLADAECLALESWVPEGQRAPTQLLVILQEQDGGDFLASTPRSLGSAGRDRTFLPLSRFQLAGWSKDADGVLDAHRIREVRIGWGGYLGTEGERIQFSFAPLEVGRRR
jgi:hypothetical protein